jgi:hypothetical protein
MILSAVGPRATYAQAVDLKPPSCRVDRDVPSASSFAFVAHDTAPSDTGVYTIALSPESTNLVLSAEPFAPGAPQVRFRLDAIDGTRNADGGAVVADGEGNECAVSVHLAGRHW